MSERIWGDFCLAVEQYWIKRKNFWFVKLIVMFVSAGLCDDSESWERQFNLTL